MKHLINCAILIFIGNLSFGQQMKRPSSGQLLQKEVRKSVQWGLESDDSGFTGKQLVPRSLNFISLEVNVGSTVFDLQTNASMPNRLLIDQSGRKVAVWTQSLIFDESYQDRGTGINIYDDGWLPNPTKRIESERTGWPAISEFGDGTLVVTSHGLDNRVHVATRTGGQSSWSESTVPTNVPNGIIWPRSATGGPDGMTLHLIGLTAPSDDFEPAPYLGVDGHLLYARSLDGGITWELIDQVIPGLDSTHYAFLSADSYSLQARGNTVVISLYGEWGNIAMYKSVDNGDSWIQTIVNDFPLDAYTIDDGYTISDIPEDPFAPDSMDIYTSSGDGATAIDENGLVHMVYSETYVSDADPTDSASNYYPGWAGIAYWNESFTDAPVTIAGLLDDNGNDTIDIPSIMEIPRYVNGTAAGMPTIVTSEGGNIFVTYAAVSEGHYNELEEQFYRHLVAVKSVDGGVTWGPEYDLINDDLVDPEFNDFVETVYPSAGNLVEDTLYILYQQDFFPGHRFSDEDDPVTENFIVHLAVPIDLIPEAGISSTGDFRNDLDIKVFPTISEGWLNIVSSVSIGGDVRITVYDLLGRRCLSNSSHGLASGLDVSALTPGAFFLVIQTEQGSASRRFFRQ